MSLVLEFVFDFASPNAYFAHQVVPGIVERTGAVASYSPCLLGGIFKSTGNQAPFVAFADVPSKLAYERLETQRFIARHGIERFKPNEHFPVNTLMLSRAAIYAESRGFLNEFIDAGLSAMWEQGLKMDDPEVFMACMNDAGFDAEAIAAGIQDPEIKAGLIRNTERAVERGAFGIPTFFVGDEMFFGKERLEQVEKELHRVNAG